MTRPRSWRRRGLYCVVEAIRKARRPVDIKRSIMAVAVAAAVIGCVGRAPSRTPSAGSSVGPVIQATPLTFTQAQADACVPARAALNASLFEGMALVITGDVQRNRERVVKKIDEVLRATSTVDPPSVAADQWAAAIAALTAARPAFTQPMTKDQYREAINALAVAPAAFDDLCKSVIRWVNDNLPH